MQKNQKTIKYYEYTIKNLKIVAGSRIGPNNKKVFEAVKSMFIDKISQEKQPKKGRIEVVEINNPNE